MTHLIAMLAARFQIGWKQAFLQGTLLPLCLAVFVCSQAKAPQTAAQAQSRDALQAAAGFDKLFLRDPCTGQNPSQPDTCIHDQAHEKSFAFGGKSGTIYDVTLRIRGIFEPTTIMDGDTPNPSHPFFKIGGRASTPDWSQWRIEISEPKQTYWLNHYPSVGHTIYKEDFEATVSVAAGATVVIRVTDGNDREIDNSKGGPDRQQILAGVVDHPLDGQMLRLDVVRVKAK